MHLMLDTIRCFHIFLLLRINQLEGSATNLCSLEPLQCLAGVAGLAFGCGPCTPSQSGPNLTKSSDSRLNSGDYSWRVDKSRDIKKAFAPHVGVHLWGCDTCQAYGQADHPCRLVNAVSPTQVMNWFDVL